MNNIERAISQLELILAGANLSDFDKASLTAVIRLLKESEVE